MFFRDKIKNIAPTDRVLEIGPGGNPHPRSDVFLEVNSEYEKKHGVQFGGLEKMKTDKKVVYYDGKIFPFKDKEFDYIICAQVVEHIFDLELFCSEMFRVGKKGYVEYPQIYYEYIYNSPVHQNILKLKDNTLFYIKKKNTNLDEFKHVQEFFYEALMQNYMLPLGEFKDLQAEGFEWENKFNLKEVKKVSELPLVKVVLPFKKRFVDRQKMKVTQKITKFLSRGQKNGN